MTQAIARKPAPGAGFQLMPRNGAGFTMIELIVVVGIIAILALMMIPGYQDKLIRDQIFEALPLADIAKAPVAASWAIAQALPADNTAAGLPAADKIVNNFVSAITVQGGAIHITFGNRANGNIRGKVLTLRPATVDDAPIVPVAWVCGYAAAPAKMTVKGENKTDIPANFLPFICRAA
jgi:type IV pilus assembly protein PilA